MQFRSSSCAFRGSPQGVFKLETPQRARKDRFTADPRRATATGSKLVRGLAWLSALAIVCCSIAQAQSAAPRLITHKIDETRLTTLPGHIHPAANAANDRG